MSKSRLGKVDEKLLSEHQSILRARYMNGKEKNIGKPLLNFRRFTSLLPKNKAWSNIKNDFVNLDESLIKKLEKDKRGNLISVMGIIVIIFIIMVVGFVFVVGGSLFDYGFKTLSSNLQGFESTSKANVSYYAGDLTFGNIAVGISNIEWVGWLLLFGMFLGLIIGAFIVREHPMYIFVYFMMLLVLFFTSIPIQRSYENLYNSAGAVGTQLQSYGVTSYMMLNLPTIILITSFISMILLFGLWLRKEDDFL